MEVNQEWTHCTESNPDVEFLIPDSLGAESDLSSHFNYRELPALQILSEPGSPVLFEFNDDPTASMASNRLTGQNPFAGERDTETDPAEALVADTASDFSENSSKDESDKNVTVVPRESPGKTCEQPPSTPARMLTCLQLSGNPTMVPETCDSLDEVPPSLDAFDHHPTIVPDSPTHDNDPTENAPEGNENKDNSDEDDDVISFKPVMATMDNEAAVTQVGTQHSVGVIESQNFHLHLSQSQPVSVLQEEDAEHDDFGLIPDVATLEEKKKGPAVSVRSQHQPKEMDNLSGSKPSFRLQKPAIGSEDAVPPEDDTEGSISVFKRIKSGVTSPLKLKRLADDSQEVVASKSVSKVGMNLNKIFDLAESSSSKTPMPMLTAMDAQGLQTKGSKEGTSRKAVNEKTMQKDLFSDNLSTGIIDEKQQAKPASRDVCTKEHEKNEEAHAFTMVFSEDVNSHCEDEDETMSYSYTEIKEHDAEKTAKTIEPHSKPLEPAPNQFSDSGSDNFILSQKRMVPSVSKKNSDSDEKIESSKPIQGDGDASMAEEEGVMEDLQDAAQEEETDRIEHSTAVHNENTAIVADDVTERSKAVTSKEDCNVMETMDQGVSSIPRYQSFAEGSTLAQTSSLDPYTFQGSQSQSFEAAARMPLSDKPYISARGKKAAVIKTMRKVLRKKSSYQEVGNKSSSSDIPDMPVPEESKSRQGRKKKGSSQVKSTSPAVNEVVQLAEDTAVQDQDHFNRPHNPAPTKSCVKQIPGSSSNHPGPNDPSKDSVIETGEVQKANKKSATVSFSTNAGSSGSVRELADSQDQEVERITVQEMITSEVIISKRTVREVFNSKGESLHKSETTEIIRKVRFQPQVTQEDTTEKIISSGHVISPSRSTSTVTTGDLADISSSSLSRTFSSGSKTSLEVLPSSQSLPTPAQRQRSTQKSETTSMSNCEGITALKATTTISPSSFTADVPPASSGKPDSKRSSAGSNTGQDLFSTPNQSIINPADSQLGKVLSSSATFTPEQQAEQTAIGPSQGLLTAGPSAISHRTPVPHSPSHTGLVSPPTTSISYGKEPFGPSLITSEILHKDGPGLSKDIQETRMVQEKGPKSGDSSPEKNMTCSSSISGSTYMNTKVGGKGRRDVLSHPGKEDMGESTDVQSTGFSVHGDSGRGPGSTVASAKTSSTSMSAQVSLQGRIVKEDSIPYILNEYKSKPAIGAKVMGKWKDGFYYPGSLSKIEPNKKAMIQFDDGSLRWVRPHEIIMASDLPVGQSVMVLADEEDGFYLPGMVMGHNEPLSEVESEELLYQVERDDGVTQRCKRSSLILSEDQAACLLSDEELRFSADAFTASSTKPGDISLDNLVEGKRSLRSVHQPGPSSSKNEAPASPPSTSTADGTGASASKSGRKRKIGPMATSTPTPKQARRGGKGTPVKGNMRSSLGSLVSSPAESRKSPRKVKMGPLSLYRSKNSSLFEGMVFMLTHVEKSAQSRAYEKQMLQYSSLDTSVDESTDIEPDETPYDKERLHFLIQQCGGSIVSSLDAEIIASASQCFVVAAEHQRTVKYMQALAAGVQVISHQWILLSVKENRLQALVAYTLPAGISIEKKKLMEGSKGCPELSRQVIMVVSNSEDFMKAWTSILSLTKCQLTTKFPARASKNDPGVDVVVSDSSCPGNVVRRCSQLNVPLVSSEWVAQCLINGRMVDVKDHHKYRHDFLEEEASTVLPKANKC